MEEKKASAEHQQTGNQMMDSQAAGDNTTSSNRLVLKLASGKDRPVGVGAGPPSPILQVDGSDEEEKVTYSFVSDFGEEDIEYALSQIFPSIDVTLVSRVRLQPRTADHLCIVKFKTAAGQKFSWPDMVPDHVEMFIDLKVIQK